MPSIKPNLSQLLSKVASILTQNNCQAYIVGGFIRDWLLDRETNDIDITVSVDAQDIAKKVARIIDGKYVLLDEANRVARVVVTGWKQPLYLDFATFSNSIEEDLERRDFTVNAMAVELNDFVSGSLHLIDPFHGKSNLKKKLIKAVSPDVFKRDAARLLRAVRLAAELDFKIEKETEQLIKHHGQLVKSVPGERLREEFLRILSLHYSSDLLRYLDQLNLLAQIIPELEELRNVAQPKEHYWNVLNHSLEAVATTEFLFREKDWKYGASDLLTVTPWSDEIEKYFTEEISSGSSRRTMLKLGGLLHDIAKPQAKTIDPNGRMRFIGHPKQGAAMAVTILNRLRFSKSEIKLVEKLVYYHLRPVQMANVGLPTSRAIYRYFRDTEGDGIDVLFLALADYLAARGPNLNAEEWEQHNRLINYMIAEHQKQQTELLPIKLIDGHELIDIFGLTSGPLIGKLLRLVHEAQAVGEVSIREEAIALVRRELAKGCQGGHCSKSIFVFSEVDDSFAKVV
jgi:poly(A) polymerase